MTIIIITIIMFLCPIIEDPAG